MFKRLFWLMVGAGFGFGVAFWLMRFVRQTAERYAPNRLSADVTDALRRLSNDIRAAFLDGRDAMREREAALRADFESRLPTRR